MSNWSTIGQRRFVFQSDLMNDRALVEMAAQKCWSKLILELYQELSYY